MNGNRPCYREIGACFGCGKLRHIIWDCPKNKRFMREKPKEGSNGDRQNPRAEGRVFAIIHRDAKATSDVVTGTL